MLHSHLVLVKVFSLQIGMDSLQWRGIRSVEEAIPNARRTIQLHRPIHVDTYIVSRQLKNTPVYMTIKSNYKYVIMFCPDNREPYCNICCHIQGFVLLSSQLEAYPYACSCYNSLVYKWYRVMYYAWRTLTLACTYTREWFCIVICEDHSSAA